jgi:hypothetical protein
MLVLSSVLLLLFSSFVPAWAGTVEVVHAAFVQRHQAWDVAVTLRHADTGWKHYADAWRVVSTHGEVFGTRTLYHPRVDEQPFTRNLNDVAIPSETTIVYVEAHDTVHGWSPQRVRVDLQQAAGERFRVQR